MNGHQLDVQGDWTAGAYSMLEVSVVPCMMKLTNIGFKDDQSHTDCDKTFTGLMKYLKSPNMVAYYNQQSFQLDEFNKRRVKRFSTITDTLIDKYNANWVGYNIQSNSITDETSWLQYGQTQSQDFTSVHNEIPRPSSWSDDIHTGIEGNYKITSISVLLNPDKVEYERHTYSLLEWLGDIGGLYDALGHIGTLFVRPVAMFALNSAMLSSIFSRVRWASSEPSADLTSSSSRRNWQFNKRKPIKKRNLFWRCCNCQSASRYNRMINQSKKAITQQLDLRRFLRRLKFNYFVSRAVLDQR